MTDCLLIDCPEDAQGIKYFEASNRIRYYSGEMFNNKHGYPYPKWVDLPPGSWELVGKASDLKEEDWDDMVDEFSTNSADVYVRYKDYENAGKSFFSSKKSGHSWIRSQGKEVSKVVLLKRLK